MSAVAAPKYREDAKGLIRKIIAEFRDTCANVNLHADFTVVEFNDLSEHVLAEYRDILTNDEMERAFRAALRAA